MIKKLLLITTTLMVLSIWADTSNWTKIGRSSDNSDYYFDLSKLRTDKGLVYVYLLNDQGTQDADGTLSSVSYKKIDCGSRGSKTLRIFWYRSQMGQGKSWNNYTPEEAEPWVYDRPGSVSEYYVERACTLAGY